MRGAMGLYARDVMQPHVVAVTPDTTLAEVADLLINRRISGVPVLEDDAIVGVVSRSDFARVISLERALAGLIAEAEPPEEFAPGELPVPMPLPVELVAQMEGRTVREVMAPSPVTVLPQTPVREVAELFVKRHVHRILVADAAGLQGIISSLDLLRLIANGTLREG